MAKELGMKETEDLKRVGEDRLGTLIEEFKQDVGEYVSRLIDQAYVLGSQDKFVEMTTKRSHTND